MSSDEVHEIQTAISDAQVQYDKATAMKLVHFKELLHYDTEMIARNRIMVNALMKYKGAIAESKCAVGDNIAKMADIVLTEMYEYENATYWHDYACKMKRQSEDNMRAFDEQCCEYGDTITKLHSALKLAVLNCSTLEPTINMDMPLQADTVIYSTIM
jgi:hypothetical protein